MAQDGQLTLETLQGVEPQTVLRLDIKNFARLRRVRLAPNGRSVVLTGKNGAGTSTVADAIASCFGGARAFPAIPMHEGTSQMRVLLETQDMKITLESHVDRKNKPTKPELSFYYKGVKQTEPRRILDALGIVGMDPMRLMNLPARALLDELKRMMKLDTSDIDARFAEAYKARTDTKKDLDIAEGKLDGMKRLDAPEAPVDTGALTAQLQRAMTTNSDNAKARANLEAQRAELGRLTFSADSIQRQIEELQRQHATACAARDTLTGNLIGWTATVDALEDIDTGPVSAALANASGANAAYAHNHRRNELRAERNQLEERWRDLDKSVKDLDAEKIAMLAGAKWPLPGLAFGEDELLYHGRPLSAASDGERRRVCTAICLKGSDKVPILVLRDASLLDADNLAETLKMAEDAGAQAILEIVGQRDGSIEIEDGTVAFDPISGEWTDDDE